MGSAGHNSGCVMLLSAKSFWRFLEINAPVFDSHTAPPPKALALLLHSPTEKSEHNIRFLRR